jgi:hypothetical protein
LKERGELAVAKKPYPNPACPRPQYKPAADGHQGIKARENRCRSLASRHDRLKPKEGTPKRDFIERQKDEKYKDTSDKKLPSNLLVFWCF